jgi:hypothetical protein
MSSIEKAVYAAIAAAAIYLVFAWATACSGSISWELIRFAIVISGCGLVLWNLVRDADETLTESASRSRRLRLLLLGLAVAAAAILSPLPFAPPAGISWHYLLYSTNGTTLPNGSTLPAPAALAGGAPRQHR